MLEYAVHQLAGYRLLARSCPDDELEVCLLRELVGSDVDRRLLPSREPGIVSVAATIVQDGTASYVSGVPVEEGVTLEGYEQVDVPGGRHAMVTYAGVEEHIGQVFAALREAVMGEKEPLTGDSIEVYHGLDEDGRPVFDLGLKLADE